LKKEDQQMSRNTLRVSTFLAALAFAAVAGVSCNTEDAKTYDVVVSWSVAGAQTCSASPSAGVILDFDQITIEVYDEDQVQDGKVISGEVPFQTETVADCSLYKYTIQRLERGRYYAYVKAWAVDADGEHLPYYQAGTAIRAPSTMGEAGYPVSLMLGKGEVNVTWGFDNYAQCGAVGVQDIVLSLAPNPKLDCSLGAYLLTDINAASGYSLTVDGLDENGDITWTGTYDGNPFDIKPGQHVDAQVILSPI
jgi:hypothetical protein